VQEADLVADLTLVKGLCKLLADVLSDLLYRASYFIIKATFRSLSDHIFVVRNFKLIIDEKVFSRGIEEEDCWVQEVSLNLFLEMIYCILGVFKDEVHIFSVLPIYIHVSNDSVDKIRELSQNERDTKILHLLEDLLHVLELNQIQSSLS
jgi:hypothetical protein